MVKTEIKLPVIVVDEVTEARGIDNGQGDASALLIQLELCPASQTPLWWYYNNGR